MQKICKNTPRPIVGLSMASEFDEKVVIGLKQLKGR